MNLPSLSQKDTGSGRWLRQSFLRSQYYRCFSVAQEWMKERRLLGSEYHTISRILPRVEPIRNDGENDGNVKENITQPRIMMSYSHWNCPIPPTSLYDHNSRSSLSSVAASLSYPYHRKCYMLPSYASHPVPTIPSLSYHLYNIIWERIVLYTF